MKKIYVVVGPTSSGKSDYAVSLAKQIDGEIISADSRQVYTELNLLSGKITDDEKLDVPHHMLSVFSVKDDFSAELFASEAKNILLDILKRGKSPIICGGSGFYIEALLNKLEGAELPKVEPNIRLRNKLESLTKEELFTKLESLDPDRATTIDKNNKVRLIRALEIIEQIGRVPKNNKILNSNYDIEWIGLDFDDLILKERILKRLKQRVADGMLIEAQKVYELCGPEKMSTLGLECRFAVDYLKSTLNEEELIKTLSVKMWQYAKRQRTWFRRNKLITWSLS